MCLKNTERIYGLIVYTGHDTKVMQNSAAAEYKFSKLEKMMHKSVMVVLTVQFLFALNAAILGCLQLNTEDSTWARYLERVEVPL